MIKLHNNGQSCFIDFFFFFHFLVIVSVCGGLSVMTLREAATGCSGSAHPETHQTIDFLQAEVPLVERGKHSLANSRLTPLGFLIP